MKIKLLRKIVAFIKEHPEHWNQRSWHCDTSHCVAGFAELDAAGYSLSSRTFTNKVDSLRFKDPNKKSWLIRTRFWKFLTARREAGLSTTSYAIGQEHLELTNEEANWLFDSGRRLEQLSEAARTGKCPDHVYHGK